jgi:hypothetical protein
MWAYEIDSAGHLSVCLPVDICPSLQVLSYTYQFLLYSYLWYINLPKIFRITYIFVYYLTVYSRKIAELCVDVQPVYG